MVQTVRIVPGRESAPDKSFSQVKQAHLDEWIKGSAVSETVTRLNLKSLRDRREVAQKLGWKSYPESYPLGWWVEDIENGFGQFKPDTPIQFPEQDEPSKYLSPKKEKVLYDAIRLRVDDEDYWQKLEADSTQPVVITEGLKKSGAGLGADIATLALAGVDMGARRIAKNRYELVPVLKRYAPGRPICLAFDSDILVKPEVQQALKRLGKLLVKAGSHVTVALLPAETKGMDDFLLAHDGEAFKRLVSKALPYEQWVKGLEAQFPDKSTGKSSGNGTPKASIIGRELAERYREQLAWNDEAGQWYRYEAEYSGIWSAEGDRAVEGVIAAELDQAISDGYSLGYLRSVSGLMQRYLLVKRWNQKTGLLPLKNGALELATNKLLPHSPGYRNTWCLPYSYNPLATCEPVQQWLLEAMGGDAQMVELLRAYLKAIVTSRTDLQRYVECLGPASTGKSTYQRLAIALVGLENTVSVELKHLEGSRFEVAEIYGKKLILVNDSDRYGGSVNNLKAITGGDRLRAERKNVQGVQGFFASGMVLVAANEAIQSSDYTSGLERRRLTIPFLKPIPPGQRRDLITVTEAGTSGDFVEYLPGLLNWVLVMPDEDVTRLVLDTAINVPSLNRWKSESLIESNPIAEWLDNRVCYDIQANTYVGVAKKIRVSAGEPGNTTSREVYEQVDRWLYASYVDYCQITGSKPVSVRRFSGLLEDLCRNQLHLAVTKGRDRNGAHFCGLALRDNQKYHNWPRPITGSKETPPPDNPPPDNPSSDSGVTDDVMDGDGCVTAETHTGVGCDGCDGLFQTQLNKNEIIPSPEQKAKAQQTDVGFKNNPSQASHPSPVSLPAVTHPSPHPSHPSSPPVVVKVIREISKGYLNPRTRKLESRYRVRLSDGTTATFFKSELDARHWFNPDLVDV